MKSVASNMELKVRLTRLRTDDMQCQKSNDLKNNKTVEDSKNSTPISSVLSTPASVKNSNRESFETFLNGLNGISPVTSPIVNNSSKNPSFSLISDRNARNHIEELPEASQSAANVIPLATISQKVTKSTKKLSSGINDPKVQEPIEKSCVASPSAANDTHLATSSEKVNNSRKIVSSSSALNTEKLQKRTEQSPKASSPIANGISSATSSPNISETPNKASPSLISDRNAQKPIKEPLKGSSRILNRVSKKDALTAVKHKQNVSPNKVASPQQEDLSSSSDSDDNMIKRKKRKSHSVEEYRNKGEIKKLVQQSINYYEKGDGRKDRKNRYKKTNDDFIYLGEGLAVPMIGWYGLQTMGPNQFIGELISMFWSSEDLAKRALHLDKVSTQVKGLQIETIEGPLLRLLISVYCDFLSNQSDIPPVNKVNYLYRVTDILSKKIRNCRQKFIENLRIKRNKQKKESEKEGSKRRLKF